MAASEGLAAAAAGNDEGPSMHEMEGPRRVLLPCGHRSLGFRRPCRTCSSCSDSAIARLTRSRNGVARCGLPVPIARSQLLRRAGAPRGPPVPIARVQLLRGARSSRSAGPDRSGPAPTRSGCPADPAPIARDPPARDCLASPCLDCSRQLVARPAPTSDRVIARLSTPRNSSPLSETRCELRSPAARRAPGVAPRAGPRSR